MPVRTPRHAKSRRSTFEQVEQSSSRTPPGRLRGPLIPAGPPCRPSARLAGVPSHPRTDLPAPPTSTMRRASLPRIRARFRRHHRDTSRDDAFGDGVVSGSRVHIFAHAQSCCRWCTGSGLAPCGFTSSLFDAWHPGRHTYAGHWLLPSNTGSNRTDNRNAPPVALSADRFHSLADLTFEGGYPSGRRRAGSRRGALSSNARCRPICGRCLQ